MDQEGEGIGCLMDIPEAKASTFRFAGRSSEFMFVGRLDWLAKKPRMVVEKSWHKKMKVRAEVVLRLMSRNLYKEEMNTTVNPPTGVWSTIMNHLFLDCSRCSSLGTCPDPGTKH